MRLPSALRAFLAGSALFTLLCFGTEAFCHFALHWSYPYDYPGVHGWISFVDFHGFFPKFAYFHSPAFFSAWAGLPYPAPAIAAFKLFLIPQPRPNHGGSAVLRFVGAMLLASWIMLLLMRSAMVRHGLSSVSATGFVLGVYAFSFAFWFEFSKGNIEWVVWAFLMGGIFCFCRKQFIAAAILIGVAGSMKIFPIVFIGLFLAARRYKASVVTLLSAGLTTLVSLWLVCPDLRVSWAGTIAGLSSFENQYMLRIRPVEVGFDHSLYAVVKLTMLAGGSGRFQARLGIYLAAVATGGCLLWLLRIRKLPVANQVLCLTVAAIVLPPVSYDYTLIHLYAVLALLSIYALEQAKAGGTDQRGGLLTALLLLAFLLSPESEFILHGIRYAGQLKCIVLLVLGYVGLRVPFSIASLPATEANPTHPIGRLSTAAAQP